MIITSIIMTLSCTGNVKTEKDKTQTDFNYSNSTEYTKRSDDSIDNSVTYEIYFRIEQPVDCLTIDVESVYLYNSFPVSKIPKRTYFIIEKPLSITQFRLKNSAKHIQIGKNYNNDWDIFSPVKICTIKNDPLSALTASVYRIRFTTFEKLPVYYNISIISDSKIVFSTDEASPVKSKHPFSDN